MAIENVQIKNVENKIGENLVEFHVVVGGDWAKNHAYEVEEKEEFKDGDLKVISSKEENFQQRR